MFAIHYAFQFFFGFFCCGIVVGRFEIVLDHLKIVVGRCGSLWVVVGFCDYHKHIPPNRVHIIQIPSAAPSFMGI